MNVINTKIHVDDASGPAIRAVVPKGGLYGEGSASDVPPSPHWIRLYKTEITGNASTGSAIVAEGRSVIVLDSEIDCKGDRCAIDSPDKNSWVYETTITTKKGPKSRGRVTMDEIGDAVDEWISQLKHLQVA